ncbi:TPA: N-6 DNA methylase [Streptococcus pyogenes]|uniref:N-6 DNA methylase n=1 Tax=Streptococcus pyogenes TaxID=1314 RepID=UPI000DA3805B|nr:N-6 DNA methylase [Streptococcus pyogenes]SQF52295.1 phage protein [Streptococcus pyogenes]VGZ08074.1 phage protein [Streptococcus pyogenes]VHA15932.1 phage protein [Streptococcus pyogenes]VHG44466.1 phage protein [Streptococcus pyogenes]HEP1464329.1 SAM-dependent DNA methyltransferase [Streptococcus pyogenes]
MLTTNQIHKLLGVEEVYKAPDTLMKIILDKEKREDLFRQFLKYETDVSYDWFMRYFEEEQADRKNKKQDFTPLSVSKLLTGLVSGHTYHESAVGTGGILIQAWQRHRISSNPFTYKPSDYWYQVEELSDRALPFLLFNMSIRGINGVVVHGDSLTRQVKNIYFLQNTKDDMLSFSDINVMPRTQDIEREFNVKEWIGDGIEHIENPLIEWI